jgi:ABC-type glycerol-3-phosphate transport system permease component
MARLVFIPTDITFDNDITIFTDSAWYSGYINSIIYVVLNTIICLVTALPAAYAFSRYSFIGDKHVFFWLLTNRMAPAAVFLLPFFQLYSTFNLIDTHIAVALAHCLFNLPLTVWILEGFISGVPGEIDETAFIDGYKFPRFFFFVFIPLIRSGIGVAAFFCFMFSWVELLFARTLTTTAAKPIAATRGDRLFIGLLVSETIPTHENESKVLAKAFEEIAGITVTHDLIQEGDVIEKLQTQWQSGQNIYDAWINDADLIGSHWRYGHSVNLTDWMAGEGKDVTLPTLDVDDFFGKKAPYLEWRFTDV